MVAAEEEKGLGIPLFGVGGWVGGWMEEDKGLEWVGKGDGRRGWNEVLLWVGGWMGGRDVLDFVAHEEAHGLDALLGPVHIVAWERGGWVGGWVEEVGGWVDGRLDAWPGPHSRLGERWVGGWVGGRGGWVGGWETRDARTEEDVVAVRGELAHLEEPEEVVVL